MRTRTSLFALLLIAAASRAGAPPEIAGCTIFPAGNIWNTPVDFLPVDPNSSAWVNTVGASKEAHADFGAGLWNGGPIGIPFTTVPGSQPRVPVSFQYADESDRGPYPVPRDAPIEGGSQATGDRHVLVLDRDNCVLYELYSAFPQSGGSWLAGSGAIFDLKSNLLRPDTWTSADAAGLPIVPGLVRYEEVASGEIRHALRFTVPETRRAYVWPARHYASSLTAPNYPPMGARFRLRADYNVTTFSPEMQVILRAFKKYGLILADNGSAWYISGAPDERWNNEHLRQMHLLQGSDFEAVDVSSLRVADGSGEARLTGAGGAVVNAGAYSTGPVAPGEIVSIFGENLGPNPPLSLDLTPDRIVTRQLGDVVVSFSGVPAPLLYVSPRQINAIVPYAASGAASARIQVNRGAITVFDATLPVIPASPGIFAVTDPEFHLNSDENPAASNGALVLFGTGEGETQPPGIDGKLAYPELPKPRLPVQVFLGGQEAELLYSGAAPDLVAGVIQVNFRIPPGLAPGRWPLTLRIGVFDSPPGPTVVIKPGTVHSIPN